MIKLSYWHLFSLLACLPLGLTANPLTEEKLIALVRDHHPILERARIELKRARSRIG